LSDFPRPRSQARPPRRDGRSGGYQRSGGSGHGGDFRREGPAGPPGPAVDYRALVEYVAKSLADKPESVEVLAFERGGGTLAIKVKMDDGDIGRFVGKGGRHIEAIRTLVRVASMRDRRRIFVDLANPPEESGRGRFSRARASEAGSDQG
jgi:uncharacterized protein